MEACYGGTDVMERSCAVARGIDINNAPLVGSRYSYVLVTVAYRTLGYASPPVLLPTVRI
jgi:hypothetical protein